MPFSGGEQLAARHGCASWWHLPSSTACRWRCGGYRARPTHTLLLSFSLEEAYTGLPPNLEPSAPAGFAFFPFRDSDQNPALFLPANVFFDTRPAG